MLDRLLINGIVIDGSAAAEPQRGNVGILNGKIAYFGEAQPPAQAVTDVQGALITPGFIDIHRHPDAALFRPDFGAMELHQGITSIVGGNCGMSVAPCPQARRTEILDYLAPVIGSVPKAASFESFSEYMALADALHPPLNLGMLVGTGTIRTACAGLSLTLSAQEERAFRAQLESALAAGALGVSAGLSYLPDAYHDIDSLARVLAPMAGGNVPLVTHVRGEGDILYTSVEEMIALARRLRVPLQISHFKCIGRRNWRTLLQKTIACIDRAREEGVEIHCDVYPWTAGSTQLACVLPPQFLEGGFAATAARLRDKSVRAACREAMEQPGADFENIVSSMGWENIIVSGAGREENQDCIGKSITEIAALRGLDPYDAAFLLLADEVCNVPMIDTITCEEDISDILRLPYSSISSDTVYPDSARPHPRGYATVPMILNHYVNDLHVLPLPIAIHKMTGAPAAQLRIAHKGLLREGYDADLAVFSPERVQSRASYLDPAHFTSGMQLVLVGGEVAVSDDVLTGAAIGRTIRT